MKGLNSFTRRVVNGIIFKFQADFSGKEVFSLKKAILLFITLFAGPIIWVLAENQGDLFFTHYEDIRLDFLRTQYSQINNGRPIRIEGYYKGVHWKSPIAYKERLEKIGFDVNKYNVLEMSLKELDNIHFAFPVILVQSSIGDLHELNNLVDGQKVALYGKYYKLEKSEYALELEVLEGTSPSRGSHEVGIVLDARVAFSPTPTPTVTSTPQPSLYQKVNNWINPKESPTPGSTETPTSK